MRKKKASAPEPDLPPCSWHDCTNAGTFKAPKTRNAIGSNRPEDFYTFCQEHIAAYNKNWDYFSGMSTEEIDAFRSDAVHGHRPTWSPEMRTSTAKRFSKIDLEEAFRRFQGFAKPAPKPERILTKPQSDALAIMDLPSEATPKDVRTRYKTLVKLLHPDVNNGDKKSEERFKRVTEAYRTLKDLQ